MYFKFNTQRAPNDEALVKAPLEQASSADVRMQWVMGGLFPSVIAGCYEKGRFECYRTQE